MTVKKHSVKYIHTPNWDTKWIEMQKNRESKREATSSLNKWIKKYATHTTHTYTVIHFDLNDKQTARARLSSFWDFCDGVCVSIQYSPIQYTTFLPPETTKWPVYVARWKYSKMNGSSEKNSSSNNNDTNNIELIPFHFAMFFTDVN